MSAFRPSVSLPTRNIAGVKGSGFAGAAGPRTRLDQGTKLVDGCSPIGWGPGWIVKWYPGAHEATIYFRGAHDGSPSTAVGGESDPDRNRSRAERRARSTVRRYCVANGVDRLMTLTYGPPFCFELSQAYDDTRRFVRRMRHHLREPFPYVWVPEPHADHERYHVHLGLNRYVPKRALEALWGHGWVDIRRLKSKRSGSERAGSQAAASYLSKYVGKTFHTVDDGTTCGRHRYEVGQGFQPTSTGVRCTSESAAWRWLMEQERHAAPIFQWSSEEIEGWEGPPTRGVRW